MQSIYLDHNAATPIRPEVVEAMTRCCAEVFANPASGHRPGQQARRKLEDAREQIAQILDVDLAPPRRDRLIFTSGGTEANNLAILGIARASISSRPVEEGTADNSPRPLGEGPGVRAKNSPRPLGEGPGVRAKNSPRPLGEGPGVRAGQLIISSAEHQSVIEPAEHLLEQGWRLDTLGLTPKGVVRIDQLQSLLENVSSSCSGPDCPPCLVSIQLANHETGVLQPITEMAALCNRAGVALHTDAIQVVGKLPVSFRSLDVAAMSVTAHKFGGPLGIGALIVRDGVPLEPLMFGGHQQSGLRPGTESASLAVGMATALDLWQREHDAYARRLRSLRDRFETGLRTSLPNIVVHGTTPGGQTFLSVPLSAASSVPWQAGMSASPDPRLPQTSNIAFPGLDGQILLMALDLAGVACSVGSACSSGSTELSPTLRAMDLPNSLVLSSLRFSLGATTTEAEIDEAVRRIVHVCKELRG